MLNDMVERDVSHPDSPRRREEYSLRIKTSQRDKSIVIIVVARLRSGHYDKITHALLFPCKRNGIHIR